MNAISTRKRTIAALDQCREYDLRSRGVRRLEKTERIIRRECYERGVKWS